MATIKPKEIPLLRRKIGIVFQDFQLLMDRSVFDNLDFVLGATGWNDQNTKKKRINDMLELVGIGEKVHAMPHTLSGGEQQRVVIARALLNNPPLILADEPTGQLDPETSEEIIKLLLAVAREQQAAALIATHDMTTVEKFPGRVFRIEEQTLKEISPLQEFNPFAPVDFNR
jgi:cell division transport system ATP-binding protein